MSEDGLTTDPKVEMEALLDAVDDLGDEIALKKAEIKVATRKYERFAKRYPDVAKALGAARGEVEAPAAAAAPAAPAAEKPKK